MGFTRRDTDQEQLATLLPRRDPVRVESNPGGFALDQMGSGDVLPWFGVGTGEPDRTTNRFAQRSYLLDAAVKPQEENQTPLMLNGAFEDAIKDFPYATGGEQDPKRLGRAGKAQGEVRLSRTPAQAHQVTSAHHKVKDRSVARFKGDGAVA